MNILISSSTKMVLPFTSITKSQYLNNTLPQQQMGCGTKDETWCSSFISFNHLGTVPQNILYNMGQKIRK
jgi:hypothetical protein